jgi:hypothetical protein
VGAAGSAATGAGWARSAKDHQSLAPTPLAQAEHGEAGDQAYQTEQGDAPVCAYCTVGGDACVLVQAYRADGKFEAVMDSGANINIFTNDLESGLGGVSAVPRGRMSLLRVGAWAVSAALAPCALDTVFGVETDRGTVPID